MIYVIVTIAAAPGKAAELVATARACIDETRKEEGCISYDYVRDTEKSDTVLVIERWRNRQALAAHLLAPHLNVWREERKPLVVSTKVEIIHPGEIETL